MNTKKMTLLILSACLVAIAFTSCIKKTEVPAGEIPGGRETLFAPVTKAETESESLYIPVTTRPETPKETTRPQLETTASVTETEEPSPESTEAPVFGDGFSDLY